MKYTEFRILIETPSLIELESRLTGQFTRDFEIDCHWLKKLYASNEADLETINYKGFAADLVDFLEQFFPDIRFTIIDERWEQTLTKGHKLFKSKTNIPLSRLFTTLLGKKTTKAELSSLELPLNSLYYLERDLLSYFDCSESTKKLHFWHWLIHRKSTILGLARHRKIQLASGELDCKKLFSLLKKETRLEEDMPWLHISSIPLSQISSKYGIYLEKLFGGGKAGESQSASAKGLAFENEVRTFFVQIGFRVETTPVVNDFGVDLIIVSPDTGRRTAVQCKDTANEVGIKSIQEVYAGKMHYQCESAMVISRSGFGRASLLLAESTSVWCRRLCELRSNARRSMNYLEYELSH